MIGFVVPMEKEARALVAALKSRKKSRLKGRDLTTGTLGKHKCAIVISGVGKIPAASATQLLLDHYDCDVVYHFGSAGGLSPECLIGDFVVAIDIVEHDYIKLFGTLTDNPLATCSPLMSRRLKKQADQAGVRAHLGRIVSGNEDVVTSVRRDALCDRFGGLSVDWESAGCALVCNLNKVPVVVIRAISDYAYEQTHDEYAQHAIDVCASVCKFLVSTLK